MKYLFLLGLLSISLHAWAEKKFSLYPLRDTQKQLLKIYWNDLQPPLSKGLVWSSDSVTVYFSKLNRFTKAWWESQNQNTELSYKQFQSSARLWAKHYLASRTQRYDHLLIPNSLKSFIQQSQYRAQNPEIISDSSIKESDRYIYRTETNKGRRLSASETWVEESGKRTLREVEVAVEDLNIENHYRFYVYNSDGELSNTSTFPVGERPAPKICVSCHLERETGLVNRFIP